MTQTNNVHTSAEMATSSDFTNSFQGFQTSNYTTKIQSSQDILFLDGKSIFSNGALSIGTSTSNPVLAVFSLPTADTLSGTLCALLF